MIVRILILLAGLIAAGAGGFLGWTNRAAAGALFPAAAGQSPWPLVGAVALAAIGLACLGAVFAPRKTDRRAAEARAAEREAALRAADTYYAGQTAPVADHPADRDWRSADLPPPAASPPEPVFASEPEPAPAPAPPPEPEPPPPPELPIAVAPPTPPVAEPAPAPPPAAEPPPVFPAAATLAPIPQAIEPPPEPPQAAPAPAPAAAAPDGSPLGRIREALAANRLDEADRLLAEERTRISGDGDGDPMTLAMLTGLAGDHAAADGRVGGAKWLWRLALQRFAKADAINAPEARAVAERLRLADQ